MTENFEPVTALLTARNRSENLALTLESLKDIPDISRTIVVDWGSETPVADSLGPGVEPSVEVIRSDSSSWHMSAALNFGLAEIDSGWVLKLDADHLLQKSFFFSNPPLDGTFLRGHWADLALSDKGLNGLCLARAEDLRLVGGWDERIFGYGHEDTDLYDRLRSQGLTERFLYPGTATHLPHPASARVDKKLITEIQSTALNRAITAARDPWPTDSTQAPRVGPLIDPKSLDPVFSERSRFRFKLAWLAGVRGLATRLDRRLYRLGEKVRNFLMRSSRPKTLVLVPSHGLGNRLRALISALDLAAQKRWTLEVVWLQDDHLDCSLTRLVNYRGQLDEGRATIFELINQREVPFRNFVGSRPRLTSVYFPWWKQKIVVRSSRTLGNRTASFARMSRIFRSWIFTDEVQKLALPIEAAADVGVHIRTDAGRYSARATFEKLTNNWSESDSVMLSDARSKTTPLSFQAAMKKLGLDGKAVSGKKILVCSDSQQSAEEFGSWVESMGWEVLFGHNSPNRDSDSVVLAMADMISLSRCGFFMGSHYSAFSECVLMLRGNAESHLV